MLVFKQKFLGVVAFFLLFCCCSSLGHASSALPFQDVPASHWALPYILKMEMREIISGYGDGTFRPENFVSQLEAVTMAVRAMGLEAETKRADFERDPKLAAYHLPTSWNAAGHVGVALEKGLLNEDNFTPHESASRAWVAPLIIQMIGAGDEIRPAVTNFNDDEQIPFWAKREVALAVEKGIITGIQNYRGGYDYKPDDKVTRAQLATLISKAERYMLDSKSQLPRATVTEIDYARVGLLRPDGKKESYLMGTGFMMFDVEQKKVDFSALQVGDLVRYHLRQGAIIFLEILDPEHYPPVEEEKESISGTLVKHVQEKQVLIIQDDAGKLWTFLYAPPVTVGDLQSGDEVDLKVAAGAIKEVALRSKATAETARGKIFFLDLKEGILTLEKDKSYYSYTIDDGVGVKYEGLRFITVEDLREGDTIEATLKDGEIKAITLLIPYQEETLTGNILAITPRNNILTILTRDGQLKAYYVSSEARITIRGISNPSFGDLKVEDELYFKVKDDSITALEVTNRGYEDEITGEVVFINISDRLITIEDKRNILRAYEIDADVDLDLGLRNPRLNDIQKGMTVALKLNRNSAYKISLQNKVEGEIEQIERNQYLLTLKNNQGRTTYKVKDAFINITDVKSATLSDLEAGQNVVLTLAKNEVVRVEVKVQKITFVTAIHASRNQLEVKDGSSNKTYSVNSETAFKIPGVSKPTLSNLQAGDIVRLDFIGTQLQGVTVLPSEQGTVLSASELQRKITIQTEAGLETVLVDDNLAVYSRSNKKISPYNLKAQDYVQMSSDGDKTCLYQAEEKEGVVLSVNAAKGSLYFQEGTRLQFYSLSRDVVVWKGTAPRSLGDLKQDEKVTLYLVDGRIIGIKS